MKIKKYIKVGTNKYKIILENDDSLVLYEDIILKFELLLKKEINNLEEILEYNNKFELYDKALSYINKKIRSESEIRKYLAKYTNNQGDIDSIIKKLYDANFINNKLYIQSYINDKIYLSLDGPIKIKNELVKLGFDFNQVEDELVIFDKDLILERIDKYINKNLKSNSKSLIMFKNKMLVNLINLGYSQNDILTCLNKIDFKDDSLKEKESEKLRKKYSKKYSGYDLEQIIKRKLYEKGYRD